jgi:hypothetical protein
LPAFQYRLKLLDMCMDYCNLGAVEILKKKVLLSGETSREGRI